MPRPFRMLCAAILLACGFTAALSPAAAQGANLLRDPGLDGAYTGRGRPDLNIPADWGLWFTESPRTESWMNLPPIAFPHGGPDPAPHGGTHALNLNRGFATYTAAVYQQVSVAAGTSVTASAWGYQRTCDVPAGSDRCASDASSGAYMRVGIDPNGGTNPYDADIVWSPNATPHDRWDQMTVTTTATGATVTIFLFTTQTWPRQINNAYWDDAALIAAGGSAAAGTGVPAAATPIPTPPPFVNFVTAQSARPDGSIIHVVQAGDTVDSIAFAYGVTRQHILDLNGMRDGRIIQIGQELLIRPPNTPEVTEEVTEAAEATAEASSTAAPATRTVSTRPTRQPSVTSTPNPDGSVNFAPTNPTPTVTPFRGVADAEPAPVLSVASGEVVPAIDPAAPVTQICVLIFEDGNANRIQENGESLLAGGGLRLMRADETLDEYETDGISEPHCFAELEAGEYVIAAEAPAGYGLTTPDQLRVRVVTGTTVNLIFGAAEGITPQVLPQTVAPDATPTSALAEVAADDPETGTTNMLRDNLGLFAFGAAAVVLAGGLGLAFLLRRR